MKIIFVSLPVLAIIACSSISTLPKTDNVKVSRDEAKRECTYVDRVEGRAASTKGTTEDALNDLKQEAANRGANYVVVKQYSSRATAVNGEAYRCP